MKGFGTPVRILAVLVPIGLGAGVAHAQSTSLAIGSVSGTAVAEKVGAAFGEWKYTLTVSWSTGAPQALSHLDVRLPLAACECVCSQFFIGVDEPAGTMDGFHNGRRCSIGCDAAFLCRGDPSIPGDEGPIIKYEPRDEKCEPGPIGSAVVAFYTDWPPAAVTTPNDYLLVKYGTKSLSGSLTGDLPGCRCATSVEPKSWGSIKIMFH